MAASSAPPMPPRGRRPDKTTLRTGADGVSILFAVDMTQPYLD